MQCSATIVPIETYIYNVAPLLSLNKNLDIQCSATTRFFIMYAQSKLTGRQHNVKVFGRRSEMW